MNMHDLKKPGQCLGMPRPAGTYDPIAYKGGKIRNTWLILNALAAIRMKVKKNQKPVNRQEAEWAPYLTLL